jgi:large subunit ribosomal protein L9
VKVILTQDVPNLGHTGDVKNVATGYARNYLFRQGLAVKASQNAMKEFEHRQAAEARREEKMAAQAEVLAEKLSGLTLTFEAKAGETGHLYGSITPAAIAEALERESGETFDRRKQVIVEPLREVGEHTVSVRLSKDVVAEIKVVVTPEGGELPAAAPEGSPAEPSEETEAE